jgi:hypothetical protein
MTLLTGLNMILSLPKVIGVSKSSLIPQLTNQWVLEIPLLQIRWTECELTYNLNIFVQPLNAEVFKVVGIIICLLFK